MEQIVAITNQGQLTIPKSFRELFGIKGATKAIIRDYEGQIIVSPKKDFWSLAGSLRSKIRLSDKSLHQARISFMKQWPRKI